MARSKSERGSVTPRRSRKRTGGTPRPRDAEATKRRLLDAVGVILARDGFSRLGINTIAEEADTDKVLIYRYFGGLPQLFEAYAESGTFWPTVEELSGGALDRIISENRTDRWQRVVHNYIEQLRRRPLTLEILAWELSERNEITARLEDVRERRSLALVKSLAQDVPPGTDLAAFASIVGGAIHYLLLRARKIRLFNGIDLRSDEGWARLEAASTAMLLGALYPAKR